jgi:transcription antitermination protein NusB
MMPYESKNNTSPRRLAREYAVQALYAYFISEDRAAAQISIHDLLKEEEMNPQAMAYFHELYNGVILHQHEMDELMLPYLDRPMDQLLPIEHCVLRLAIFELLYQLNVPFKVIINEALELAKIYGATDGFKYVNGILDQVSKKVRATE